MVIWLRCFLVQFTNILIRTWLDPAGPVSGISYHPTGESNGSMQPSTRQQSQNGSSAPPRLPPVAYARTANNNGRPRLQDPYAITVDPESSGGRDSTLPNSLSTWSLLTWLFTACIRSFICFCASGPFRALPTWWSLFYAPYYFWPLLVN